MPRVVSMVVWCLLVVTGVIVIVAGSDRVRLGPVAPKFLPRNTWLTPATVTMPGYSGRYVVAKDGIKQDVALRPDDVADQPVLLQASAARLLLALPLHLADLPDGVNAGSKVQLCGKAPTSVAPVTVEAIGCDANGACTAMVEWPSSAAADVSNAFKGSPAELRLAANNCN